MGQSIIIKTRRGQRPARGPHADREAHQCGPHQKYHIVSGLMWKL